MRRASQNRLFAISTLEHRQLLSGGNVRAGLVGGTLTITGDNSANEVAVEQTTEGLRVRTISGTKLNGTTNGILTFVNPTQTTIDLKGGNDRLTLGDYLGGGVSVQMGAGHDQVNLSGINTDGDLKIDLGAGNDGLAAHLGGVSHTDANVVGGNVTLLGGAGGDRMILESLNALNNLTLDAGADNDVVLLGSGSTNGTTSVLLGNGNDVASLANRTSRGLFSLTAAAGDDLVGVIHCEFQQPATFDLGVGKDALLTSTNLFLANVTRAGGTGNDTLYSTADSFSADRTVTGFEILPTTQSQVQSLLNKLNLAFA